MIFHVVTLLSNLWQMTGVHFYRTDRKYFIAYASAYLTCSITTIGNIPSSGGSRGGRWGTSEGVTRGVTNSRRGHLGKGACCVVTVYYNRWYHGRLLYVNKHLSLTISSVVLNILVIKGLLTTYI